MGGFNASALNTSGGLLATATAVGTSLAGLLLVLNGIVMAGKRKKRDNFSANGQQQVDEQLLLQQMVFKVLNELDESDCTALALCDAIAISPEKRTPVQDSLITTLSPQPGVPLAWSDVKSPRAKYQHAAFIGLWASMTANRSQCGQVFPKCIIPTSEVLRLLTHSELPCLSPISTLNTVRS